MREVPTQSTMWLEPCEYYREHGAHEVSAYVCPGWWRCKACGIEWPGPTY